MREIGSFVFVEGAGRFVADWDLAAAAMVKWAANTRQKRNWWKRMGRGVENMTTAPTCDFKAEVG
jgi:hypothetical protein